MTRRKVPGTFRRVAFVVVVAVVWVLSAGAPEDVETAPVAKATEVVDATTVLPAASVVKPAGPRVGVGGLRCRVVRAADSEPVSGFPVAIEREGPGGGPVRRVVWSAHDGRCEVAELDVVPTYTLRLAVGAWEGASRKGLVLTPNETLDLGDLLLEALGALHALVVDEKGVVVSEAHVAVTIDPEVVVASDVDLWPLAPDPPRRIAWGTTDQHGRVHLEGVPPGLVAVRATHAAWRGATTRTAVPGAGTHAGDVTLVLTRPSGLFVRVVDDGHPVEGVPVSAGLDGLDAFEPKLGGVTDAEGRVALLGFAGAVVADLFVDLGPRGAYVVRRVSTEAEYLLEIERPELLTVLAVDRADEPVAGARVAARPAARCRTVARASYAGKAPAPASVEVVGVTDPLGHVTLRVERDVTGPTWAAHPEYAVVGNPPQVQASGRPRRRKSGKSGPPSLPYPRIVFERAGSVSGRVVNERREPVAGAMVSLLTGDAQSVASTTSGAAGDFVLREVVAARSPVVTAVSADGTLAGQAWTTELVGNSGEVRVAPMYVFVGRVVDATGAPVGGATVRVVDAGVSTLTSADGSYRLSSPGYVLRERPETHVMVVAFSAGVGGAGALIRVPAPGRVTEVPLFTLGSTSSVEGFAVDADGNAVAFPVIDLVDEGGTARRVAAADAYGRFVVRDVPPGRWVVRARTSDLVGVAVDTASVEPLPAPGPSLVRVVMYPGVPATGQVVGPDDVPIPGVRVRVSSFSSGPRGRLTHDETRTDALGQFRLLGSGRAWSLEVWSPDAEHGKPKERLSPKQGEPTTIELR